jgi:hypothetical protein
MDLVEQTGVGHENSKSRGVSSIHCHVLTRREAVSQDLCFSTKSTLALRRPGRRDRRDRDALPPDRRHQRCHPDQPRTLPGLVLPPHLTPARGCLTLLDVQQASTIW